MKHIILCFIVLSLILVDASVHPRSEGYRRSLSDPLPHSGNQRLLVLAVEYQDQKGMYTGSAWKNGFFAEFQQYYAAQSYNTLQYSVDVVTVNSAGTPVINDPTSKSYIPVTQAISVYANGQYGWNFGSPYNLHTIVREAAKYLDSKGFDWTPYTISGSVTNVMIMSAGTDYRYASSDPNAASKYLLSTSYSGASYRTTKNSLLNTYTFCSEHTQNIGSTPLVMAHIAECSHEFGHGLGVPDLYDLSYQVTGVGYFDIMCYGLYALHGDGSTPTGYGAWTKTMLGWAQPRVIKTNTVTTLGPVSSARTNMLQIFPSASSTNYYLVENRQPIDKWDKNFEGVYGNGIVIWYVNAANAQQYTQSNRINTYGGSGYPSSPSVIVIEADGNRQMSNKGSGMNYGSRADVWQLQGRYVDTTYNMAIAITALSNGVYTISVTY